MQLKSLVNADIQLINKKGEKLRNVRCLECGADMKIQSTLKSGNSKFVTWQCTKCLNKKTLCEGVLLKMV